MGKATVDQLKWIAEDLFPRVFNFFSLPVAIFPPFAVPRNVYKSPNFITPIVKAIVINILRRRQGFKPLFDRIVVISEECGVSVFVCLERILTFLRQHAYEEHFTCTFFLFFTSLLVDFMLYLHSIGNFLDVTKDNFLKFWCEYFKGYLQEDFERNGGFDAVASYIRNHEFLNFSDQYIRYFIHLHCTSYNQNVPKV